tara:strand:+ start:12386 stop:13315 length:930 start_codon:yes stop_codon:yes gene_type:complete
LQNNPIQDIIIEKSKELGFDLIGFSSASGINTKIDQWIELGFHASMKWMKSSVNQRREILKYFPKAKTVISFGYNYFTESNRGNKNYKISNYAWGNDYHIVLKEKLYEIIKTISLHNKNFEYRVCVDTSPLMEKHWGQKAGLGWIGKHTNLINSKIGTWFFLSEIIIDFELEFNKPYTYDLCGSCTKCIDACPTEALEDYVLDANKCISYLTIEHRESIPKSLSEKINNWIYGCDICQEVCPWNLKYEQLTEDINFKKRLEIDNKTDSDWENLSVEDYQKSFKKSSIKRTKYSGITRNILAAKQNKNLD